MGQHRSLIFVGSLLMIFAGTIAPLHAEQKYSQQAIIDGFNKTVFGSEYSALLQKTYVHKFPGTVRFYIHSDASGSRKAQVRRFILSLKGLIHRLPVKIVSRERDANFVVHIVKRRDYERTVSVKIFKGRSNLAQGRCMVRSIFTRAGISRSDAVIVSDEGESLFRRCMTEEILQGLGPLNDDRSLSLSMFNDTSHFTNFRRFDRYILNMLYDPKVQNGASKKVTQPVLASAYRRARRRISGN